MAQADLVIELVARIFSDPVPEAGADACFLFAQSPDNEPSVFGAARSLIQSGKTPRILFVESEPVSGFPGFEVWRDRLIATGVPSERITGVPVGPTPLLHTLIESQALVRFADRHQLRNVFITAAPFHQLRAYMTAATAVIRAGSSVRLFSHPGLPLPWEGRAVHSQGTLEGSRADLLGQELLRIARYHEQGDLLSPSEVLDYMRRRNGTLSDDGLPGH